MPNFFTNLDIIPQDPIFALNKEFLLDNRIEKINLGIGVITNDLGNIYQFQSLQNFSTTTNNHYLPIEGDESFKDNFEKIFLDFAEKEKIVSIQTVGGTQANFLAGKLFSQIGYDTIYFPNYTWSNHLGIFEEAGLKIKQFDYYNANQATLSENFFTELKSLPDKSLISLDACGQNPTGVDLDEKRIDELCKITKEKQFLFFLDAAYIGLCNPKIENDLLLAKKIYQTGLPFAIAFSLSKNMSLYGHRLGILSFLNIANEKEKIATNLEKIMRTTVSNSPRYPSDLALKVLQDSKIRQNWLTELQQIRQSLINIRQTLVQKLNKKNIHIFDEIKNQTGLFSLLNKIDTEKMKKDFSIYLPSSGRINISGIKQNNVDKVVEALSQCIIN